MFYTLSIIGLITQQVFCAPVIENALSGKDNPDKVNWQDFYLQKYEKETNEDDLFDTGDDWDLKEYYDYIDKMDEEEKEEILNTLHEEHEMDIADIIKSDVIKPDDVKPEDIGTDLISTKAENEEITEILKSIQMDKTDDISTQADENGEITEIVKTLTDDEYNMDVTDKYGTPDSVTSTNNFSPTNNQLSETSLGSLQSKNAQTSSPAFQPIPLPSKFEHYDVISRDGVITLEELALVTGATENIRQAFQESDTNGKILLSSVSFSALLLFHVLHVSVFIFFVTILSFPRPSSICSFDSTLSCAPPSSVSPSQGNVSFLLCHFSYLIRHVSPCPWLSHSSSSHHIPSDLKNALFLLSSPSPNCY